MSRCIDGRKNHAWDETALKCMRCKTRVEFPMSKDTRTIDHLRMIKYAAEVQAKDFGLFSVPVIGEQLIAEAYLQESLRDLHRVIENGDIEALERIEARLNP